MASALNPTPPDRLVDQQGRPYFLWDMDLTLEQFQARLEDEDELVRLYFLAKLMREAKPDDVLAFASAQALADNFEAVAWRLGRSRDFWAWILAQWKERGYVHG